jgi:hypothetical protein
MLFKCWCVSISAMILTGRHSQVGMVLQQQPLYFSQLEVVDGRSNLFQVLSDPTFR